MSQQVVRNTTRSYPLRADDVASLAVLYGPSNWNASYGSILGQVADSSGKGVALASVVALPVTGQPVSTLTNPDGTYQIEGLPPGQYLLYIHPLPPDADVTLPVDAGGNPLAASAPFGTVFYSGAGAGTLDPAQAQPVAVQAGAPVTGENFTVASRAAVPIYDVVTFSYFDSTDQTYTYGCPAANPQCVLTAVTPAFVNAAQSATGGVATVTVQSANGATPVPQSAELLGGIGASLPPVACCTPAAVALYFNMPAAGAAPGPRHLVLNFGDDIYVLPNAVVVVNNNPPAIAAVTANSDGSATVTGANLASTSQIFFDGIEAAVATPFSGTLKSGSLAVAPPPGFSGQKASVVAYNDDWQSSITLDSTALVYGSALPDPPPYYSYPAAAAPVLTSVPSTLPGGAASRVDITAANMNFVAGQVTVGLGTSDAQVRDIFVLSPSHLVANVVTAANPVSAASEISVISGFQIATRANAFQAQPATMPPPPYITGVANGIAGEATIYGNGYATLTGVNLGMARGSVQATLTDSSGATGPALVIYGSENQVNLMIPGGAAAGLASLVLNNGMTASPPLALEIALPPPSIVGIAAAGSGPATVGGLLWVQVAGLDPTVLSNLSRVAVTLDRVSVPIVQITSQAGGLCTIEAQLTGAPAGPEVALAVSVDGSSRAALPVSISEAQ